MGRKTGSRMIFKLIQYNDLSAVNFGYFRRKTTSIKCLIISTIDMPLGGAVYCSKRLTNSALKNAEGFVSSVRK